MAAAVIGIGNPDRGDDAVGRAVARWLSGRLPEGVALAEESGEATALIDRLAGLDAAWLIDASGFGGAPGGIHRLDAAAGPLPQGAFPVSSHGLGLAEAVELSRALDQLPPRCVIYAIEAGSMDPGEPLSPAVEEAVAEAGRRILAEVEEAHAP